MTTTKLPSSGGERTEGAPSVLAGTTVDLEQRTVADAVAEHARSRPQAPALLQGDQPAQSYAELWDDASRLAGALQEAGVGRGDQVAIWATRSVPVVAAAVAAMALGAAYLPIDPTYPAARVRRILEVGDPRVIVCADARALAGSLPRGVPVVDLHAGSRSAPIPAPVARPADVAYTVFTTGSTGLPKGVLVSHRALGNYLGWAQELTAFGPDDATPCFASLGFDHAVTCLWLPLLVGGSVQLIPDSWDPRPWLAPRERPFAFIKITPSHVRLFERIARPDYRAVTRTVMFGGERLDAALVAGLAPRLEGVRLLNHYGPTEATVGCTAYRFDAGDVSGEGALPIGVPVWNSRAYVVDAVLGPVPAGEEGELVLAGACVADGYLGGGDDDRARFVPESAMTGGGDGQGAGAYRTGDRCVVRDGVLHYLGRLDEQVKVRGHRIEIQEVHDLVVSVPGVLQAAVAVSQVGLGGLELFVVVEPGGVGAPGGKDDTAGVGQGPHASEEPGVGAPGGKDDTAGVGQGPHASEEPGVGAPGGKDDTAGVGQGPHASEEPGVGAPGGKDDTAGVGQGPHASEEPGVGAPGGKDDTAGVGQGPHASEEPGVGAPGGKDDTVSRVLEHLRANLPAAAVPGKVWVVPHLVANAHGKWDADATRALAATPRSEGNEDGNEEVSS